MTRPAGPVDTAQMLAFIEFNMDMNMGMDRGMDMHRLHISTHSSGLIRWRWLAGLTALVLAVHVLVLEASPNLLGVTSPPTLAAAHTFSTRTIAAEPPPAPSPAQSPTVTRAEPLPPPKRLAKNLVKQAALPSPGTEAVPIEATSATREPGPASDPISIEIPAPSTVSNEPKVEPTVPAPLPAASSATGTALNASPAGINTTPVTAMNLPASVNLQFKVTGSSKGLNYFANAQLAWLNSGSHYDAAMKVSAFLIGSRSMTSVGLIKSSGLAPTRFADKFKSEMAAHFEGDKGKITFSANSPDAPWIEGAQDRVSVFIQLGGMLAGNPNDFPIGSSIAIYTAGPRDADVWTFKVEAEEKLQLPAGDMTTLRLTRTPRREYDQKIEIWYAPSLGYLPVRNRITQSNGDFVDQQLTEVRKP